MAKRTFSIPNAFLLKVLMLKHLSTEKTLPLSIGVTSKLKRLQSQKTEKLNLLMLNSISMIKITKRPPRSRGWQNHQIVNGHQLLLLNSIISFQNQFWKKMMISNSLSTRKDSIYHMCPSDYYVMISPMT